MATTTRGENGWQYGKTALECHRYMFDNEIATDVCFEVGPPEGKVVNIRAHKYVVISRSEVLEALFFSGMKETQRGPEAKIRIEDIEPDVFKQMLRFFYCDSADINANSVFKLINAANKYMLPKLVQLCCGYIQKNLESKNVCFVLNESLFFEEANLTKHCLDLIEEKSSEVLKPENLQSASHQTMKVILQMDSLAEDETVIYDACIKWAKAQLKIHQSIDQPNDQQIREMLGDLIYDIRFPTMEAKTFAKLVENSTILSYENKSTILCNILDKQKRNNMKFSCNERFNREQCVDRGGCVKTDGWSSGPDAIDLITNRKIVITGLGLLPEIDPNGSGYTVDLEIVTGHTSLFKMSTVVPRTGNSTPHKIAFRARILIEPGNLYTIFANSCAGKYLYRRDSCQPICAKDNVTFTFYTAARRNTNATNHISGQIPQIYFSIPK